MFSLNYNRELMEAGPVYMAFGLIALFGMDLLNIFLYDVLVVGNIIVSWLTFFLGVALTVIMRKSSRSKGSNLLVWAILALILWLWELGLVIMLMVIDITGVMFYIASLIWRKYRTKQEVKILNDPAATYSVCRI